MGQPTSTRSLTQPQAPSATLSTQLRASHQLVPISFSSTCLSVSRPTECQMATRTRSTSNVTLSFTFSNQLRCDCSIKPYSDHIKKHLSFYFPNKMLPRIKKKKKKKNPLGFYPPLKKKKKKKKKS